MKKSFLVFILLVKLITVNAQSSGIQWTNVAYLIITGQTLQKVSNVRTEWNAGAISEQSFYGDGWVDFKFPVYKYAMMGFSTYNTSVNPSSIKYAIYTHINGFIYIYENGNQLPNIGKGRTIHIQYSPTDIFRVERKNGVVYYKKNGTVFYTSKIPSTGPLHVDCSFYQASATITVTNFMFGLVWTGTVSQDWDEAANWSLNRVPTAGDHVIINTCSTCPKLGTAVNVGALQLNTGSILSLDSHTVTVGEATILNGSKVESNQGKLQANDFVEIKNSIFTGIITLEKTGGTANSCYGGNTFSPELKIINSSNNNWQTATQSANMIKTF